MRCHDIRLGMRVTRRQRTTYRAPAEAVSMRKLGTVTLAMILPVGSMASAKISLDDTNETSFDIGGTITAECKVNNNVTDAATTLDLTSTTAQNASSVSVWCNTGQSSANTTYSSINDGFLVSDAGERIPYNINVGDQGSNLSLTTPQTIQQATGTGDTGESISTSVAILPQVNGFESSGAYNDTIAVTVTYN